MCWLCMLNKAPALFDRHIQSNSALLITYNYKTNNEAAPTHWQSFSAHLFTTRKARIGMQCTQRTVHQQQRGPQSEVPLPTVLGKVSLRLHML